MILYNEQIVLVAGLGLEPRLSASKAGVLPLDDPAVRFVYNKDPTNYSSSLAELEMRGANNCSPLNSNEPLITGS